MSSETSRNNILNKIKAALTTSTRLPFPDAEGDGSVFQPLQQDVVVEFAEQFTALGGKFAFCANDKELQRHFSLLAQEQNWTKLYATQPQCRGLISPHRQTDDIINCHASVTDCETLVARTGTVVLSAQNGGRITSVYAPVHVCIAYTSQLFYDISDALLYLTNKHGSHLPSLIAFATGPSRTADIEKTLVVGVHGPKEVYLFLMDDLEETA
jgi:L-lactate dehydrogenase complex protein LldG